MKKRAPDSWQAEAMSRQPEKTLRERSMRGKYETPPGSVTAGSTVWLMGTRPEVMSPAPPWARSAK